MIGEKLKESLYQRMDLIDAEKEEVWDNEKIKSDPSFGMNQTSGQK